MNQKAFQTTLASLGGSKEAENARLVYADWLEETGLLPESETQRWVVQQGVHLARSAVDGSYYWLNLPLDVAAWFEKNLPQDPRFLFASQFPDLAVAEHALTEALFILGIIR